MSENTKIEWCDHTFNPWIGCTKVSPGCLHCYAEVQTFTRAQRGQGRELWGKGMPRHRTSAQMWRDPLKWNKAVWRRCRACGFRWDGGDGYCPQCGNNERDWIRPRAFPSMCDWLDDEVPIEWLADFLKLMHSCQNLDWLLLSKRPENFFVRVLTAGMHMMGYRNGQTSDEPSEPASASEECIEWVLGWSKGETHPANVWIGTSAEDQQRADQRIPALLKIPAQGRFLSVEPLLGAVDIVAGGFYSIAEIAALEEEGYPIESTQSYTDVWNARFKKNIQWVIVGGESGPKSRPCDTEWIYSILGQCVRAGVPCFVKQLGANVKHGPSYGIKHPKGGDPSEWPTDLRVRQFPTMGRAQ